MKHKPFEAHHRSISKAISYRAVSLIADATVAYFVTRNVALSAGIVVIVNLYSTLLYYAHERIWAHVGWGHKR